MNFFAGASCNGAGGQQTARETWQGSNLRSLILLAAVLTLLAGAAPRARGQANVTGTWQTLSNSMPINPIHTALMSNGKILIVSGSGNYPAQTTFYVGVWDPSTNSFTNQQTQSWDQFCNGIVVLPDGRPFIVGGNLQYDPFHGWNRTTVYDPATGKYSDMEDMAHGRWYPTDTILGDGRLMTFSGLDENGNTNPQVEIYKVGVGWAAPSTAPWTPPLYPRMHLLPNGKVFYSGSTTQSRTFDPSNNSWSGVIATTNYGGARTYGSSVLFPLTPGNSYKPKVIIFGGGNPSTNTTEIIDLSVGSPAWTYGPNMSQPRIEMNATLLPNGRILTVGGSLNDEDTSSASLQADLYDTNTNTMGSAGSNAFARLYHSVSLLLPDGTVWVAGGNPTRGTYDAHVEIYTPPYLYNSSGGLATRPTISSLSNSTIGYGTAFTVNTPDAANISSVILMRDGAATHAFDMDQRMVGLNFSKNSGSLSVTGPPNGNTAPPGYYMIFLMNSSGVPSVAKFLLVSKTPTDTAPKGTITSPSSDITIAPGQSVNFAGTGSGSISAYSWVYRGGNPGSSTLANPGSVTFSNAGIYTAVFTVTDSAGNTDPSPATRTITVTNSPAPKLTGVNPNSGARGKSGLSINLTGSNFLSSPSCSFGNGITVSSCTYNSSTSLTAVINVQTSASTGSRNVTVTNTDGQSSTLSNAFTVQTGGNPAPSISSVSPNSGNQGQSNLSVVISGTNFLANPSCDFDSDQGLTVSACTYNSATKITATLSIAANAVVGGHSVSVTDTDGQGATLSNGFTVLSAGGGGGGISFGSGFSAGSMVVNGNASIAGSRLTVTPNAQTQAGSAWFPSTVNIQSFTNDFTFQTTSGSPTADGFTFALQGNNTAALGASGGSLGYKGIGNSVAVKFDLYSNSGEGADSTGLYLNGALPTTPSVDMSSSGLDLHSGHVMKVHMTYDGTNLAMTITDATTAAVFSQTWAVNIPGAVGGNVAYAGFTGGTGGYTSLQQILTWTMTSGSGTSTAATPTFSPAAGSYSSTQSVTISSQTSGATIYYTTNGNPPTHSSAVYSTPVSVSSSETLSAIAAKSGYNDSGVGTAAYTISGGGGGGGISFGSGFTSGSMVVNGNAAIAGTSLTVTPNAQTQAGSAWFPTAVNIQSFTSDFTFQTTSGSPTADGFTFAIQGNNTSALGASGGSLGYKGIGNSVAVKFDLYSNGGEGVDSTGLYLNGALPTTPAVDMSGSGVDLHSGHVMKVHMSYDGTNLAMTVTDATTAALFSQTWAVNIPGTVGGSTAYAGFTGGTGGYTSLQQILTWTMTSGAGTSTVATPTFSPAGGSYASAQNVTISTQTSGATIYYTTNGNPPTTNSAVYSKAIKVSASETLQALAVKSGSNNSAVAAAAYTIGTAPAINYASGFSNTGLTLLGNAGFDGTRLLLTDTNAADELADVWYDTKVNVQKFTTDFQFQLTSPNADGITFIIQNSGTGATGSDGGGLGYGSDVLGNPGIPTSVAVKFDLYDNNGEGTNSTGLYTGGASPTTPAVTLGGGVDLHSGDVMAVHIVYDGTNLTMSITDTTNSADTFTQVFPVNIPSVVGGNNAYVGFGGGTGGLTAKQEILNWTYTVN